MPVAAYTSVQITQYLISVKNIISLGGGGGNLSHLKILLSVLMQSNVNIMCMACLELWSSFWLVICWLVFETCRSILNLWITLGWPSANENPIALSQYIINFGCNILSVYTQNWVRHFLGGWVGGLSHFAYLLHMCSYCCTHTSPTVWSSAHQPDSPPAMVKLQLRCRNSNTWNNKASLMHCILFSSRWDGRGHANQDTRKYPPNLHNQCYSCTRPGHYRHQVLYLNAISCWRWLQQIQIYHEPVFHRSNVDQLPTPGKQLHFLTSQVTLPVFKYIQITSLQTCSQIVTEICELRVHSLVSIF